METIIREKPFVDVILPNYNKAEFLDEAINSVISQSYKNWKLLIIDDGSNDASSKIILKYKNEKNIKTIFLSKNKGVSFSRNLGIRLSNSKYIAFIDSDDYWTKDKLADQIFFMENFKDKNLNDPADANHGLDLDAMALNVANDYSDYKKKQKAVGNLDYAKLPCVNHPVFKGKDVNYDPREVFVNDLFKEKGINNVFLDFYHSLVQALFKAKVSKNVYCVNIDAVIAVILLKIVWSDFNDGKLKEEDIESASFATFLFGRMIGCAAEIDDHISRGKNMDTRTPASKCSYVG